MRILLIFSAPKRPSQKRRRIKTPIILNHHFFSSSATFTVTLLYILFRFELYEIHTSAGEIKRRERLFCNCLFGERTVGDYLSPRNEAVNILLLLSNKQDCLCVYRNKFDCLCFSSAFHNAYFPSPSIYRIHPQPFPFLMIGQSRRCAELYTSIEF